jgi:uncharacterized membrane protein
MQKRFAVFFVALFLVLTLLMNFAFSRTTEENNNMKQVVSASAAQLVLVPIGRCGELCDDNGPLLSNP